VTKEYEHLCEDITMKAVADTVEKLLVYPFGFHGDTGIRDYFYARLHVYGGERLDVDDPLQRPGYSTLLLQSEHYTRVKYKNTGEDPSEARFDLALALPPPKSTDAIEHRYAENLDAFFAFELGKNKSFKDVIDPEMSKHNVDTITETSDISKLYRELMHHDLRQGWGIEFYDSRTTNGASIISKTLEICKKLELKEGKKLVVVFVGFSPDGGKHRISSNDPNVQLSLIEELAKRGIDAGPYSNKGVMMKEHETEKGWYFLDGENKILAFVNAKGSCSMRQFDANDGTFLGKENKKNGDYQVCFSEILKGATSLYVREQPNLGKGCKHRLPSNVLTELRQQVIGKRGA